MAERITEPDLVWLESRVREVEARGVVETYLVRDREKDLTYVFRLIRQLLSAPSLAAERTATGGGEPVAYRYTLHKELGSKETAFRLTNDQGQRIWGERGRDYSPTYEITIEPVYLHQGALSPEAAAKAAADVIDPDWFRNNGGAVAFTNARQRAHEIILAALSIAPAVPAPDKEGDLLREAAEQRSADDEAFSRYMNDIKALQADNAKLRAALRPFAQTLERYRFGPDELVDITRSNGDRLNVLLAESFAAASAALKASS